MRIIRRSFFAALIVGAFVSPAFAQDATNPSMMQAPPPTPAPAPEPQPGAAPAPAGAPAPAMPKPKKHVAAKPKPKPKMQANLKDVIYLDTKDGRVVIQLRPDLAPKNVAQVEQLTKMGFYNGLTFHRVIAGFMAQTGDPTGTGAGGSQLPNLPSEFTTSAHFVRGTVGMARTEDPNSANSQFFICYAPMASLDGQYTIVGQVTQGMEFIDAVKKGSGDNGMVTDPDRIVKMQLASDAGPMKKKVAAKPGVKKVAAKKPKPKPAANAGANPAAGNNPAPATDANAPAPADNAAPPPGGGDTGAAPAPIPPPPGGGQQ